MGSITGKRWVSGATIEHPARVIEAMPRLLGDRQIKKVVVVPGRWVKVVG